MSFGAVGQRPGDVLTGEQAGDADVAAEEVVGDLVDGDVVAGVPGQQGSQDAGTVGPGQHGDGPRVGHRGRDGSQFRGRRGAR